MYNDNKVILVTGASRGIGKTIYESLRSENYLVIGTTHNTVNNNLHQLDISCSRSITDLFEYIDKEYGRIDVVINNAGISQRKEFTELNINDLNTMFNTNLRGTTLVCIEAVKRMLKQKSGNIINIASIAGVWGGTEQIHYSVCKAGIINLTKSISKTYASKGIRCNCISPGLIETDMIDVNKVHLDRIPIGRVGKTQDMIGIIEFLISDSSEYIIGENININGGML